MSGCPFFFGRGGAVLGIVDGDAHGFGRNRILVAVARATVERDDALVANGGGSDVAALSCPAVGTVGAGFDGEALHALSELYVLLQGYVIERLGLTPRQGDGGLLLAVVGRPVGVDVAVVQVGT